MKTKSRLTGIGSVLLLAVLIRGGVLFFASDSLRTDPDGYRRLAENLVEHGVFGNNDVPTAYRPPLYPLMLTGCVALGDGCRTAIAVLHVLLGVGTVWLTFLLARCWRLSDGWAWAVAILVACDPILLNQSMQVMTETPAAFLTVAALLAVARQHENPTLARTLLAAFLLGLDILCRPTFLLFAALLGAIVVFEAWRRRKSESNAWLQLPIVFFAGIVVTVSPWAIRNQIQFGRPIVTTTHGGYTLLLANNPDFYNWLHAGHWGDIWRGDEFNADWDRRRPRNELQADRQAYDEARTTIRQNPGTFMYACGVHVGRLWSPLPHQIVVNETALRRLSRYAVSGWYLVAFAAVLLGVWQIVRHRQPSPPGTLVAHALLLVLCLTAAHTFYWTDMRMRAPAVPVVALVAIVGIRGLLTRARSEER
jgi:4-amino-4-deoxy-L-arabinose transferase-like glycosyltransferase